MRAGNQCQRGFVLLEAVISVPMIVMLLASLGTAALWGMHHYLSIMTDTAAALRAAEIEADIFFKATMVDGVYDKDPHKYPDAVKYDTLTFADILAKGLQVMDSTAAAMCKDNNIPILVFDLARPDNIYDACMGENIGTLVK
jgi:uridylate kinase